MPVDHTEAGFESNIEEHLLTNGYLKGLPENFNKQYALDDTVLFEFLEASQPDELARLKKVHKDQYKTKILKRLHKELDRRGMIDVLRHGIKDYGVKLNLAYAKPASSLNPKTIELYHKNRVTVTRQVYFSDEYQKSIDMLISINGLPMAVLELKNPYTGQTVENAIRQFKKDRDPKELLFQFKKRAIVFFAVDPDEVYMATRLLKDKTFFLPFNRGWDGGKGNPPVEDNYKTAYLWEEVLQKDSLLDILFRFVYVKVEEVQDSSGDVQKKEILIFPRYHQLDAVRKLEQHVLNSGVGDSYLIQHSAGSGKTNSISWLSHRLSKLHDGSDNNMFNSVVVITDRRVLDKQLQDSVYQLEHQAGVVEKIDENSNQLAEALASGTKIIVTTLQKFPVVLDKIREMEIANVEDAETDDQLKKLKKLADKNFAIIIDEAHSSQTGKSAGALKEVLAAKSLEEAAEADRQSNNNGDTEEQILNEIIKRGQQDNISFFAFTATPKQKTLELFGTYGEDEKPHPFHIYRMRQAIEEGFILDVLQNYTTYETYFKIAKKIADDPEVDKKKASKAIARFVSLHPHNIAQKTEIMVEHFRQVTRHKIGGRAKAMVVTSSRLHAVRYKQAFDKYIKEHNYHDLKTLVAFSGTVDDDGVSHTEAEMNNFGEKELPRKFATDEYKILLVAEKYQTGFDQPLLHTMYVDKKLDGIKAVQTLSRLNRTCKGKTDTFVLDFVNDHEDIKEAFKPYYQTTAVSDVTEPNLLYDLQTQLDAYKIYTQQEIDRLNTVYYKPGKKRSSKEQGIINAATDKAVERFKNLLSKEEQDGFKSDGAKYVRLYSFILQIGPFADVDLHKLYVYLTFLLRKLSKNISETVNLGDDVALEYYRNQKTFDGSISLVKEDSGPLRNPGEGGGTAQDPEKAPLSSIIEKLNDKFGTDFSPADQLSVDQLKEDFFQDEELARKAKTNTLDNFKYSYYKKFMDKTVDRMGQNQKFFMRILDDEDFRGTLMDLMLVETYERLRAGNIGGQVHY